MFELIATAIDVQVIFDRWVVCLYGDFNVPLEKNYAGASILLNNSLRRFPIIYNLMISPFCQDIQMGALRPLVDVMICPQ